MEPKTPPFVGENGGTLRFPLTALIYLEIAATFASALTAPLPTLLFLTFFLEKTCFLVPHIC